MSLNVQRRKKCYLLSSLATNLAIVKLCDSTVPLTSKIGSVFCGISVENNKITMLVVFPLPEFLHMKLGINYYAY